MTMIAIDVLFPRLGSHKSLQVAITVPKFNDIEIELFYGYSGLINTLINCDFPAVSCVIRDKNTDDAVNYTGSTRR